MLGRKQRMVVKAAGFLFCGASKAVSDREHAKRSCEGGALGI